MARYIDADKLKDEYYELFHHGTIAVKSVLSVFVNLLDKIPTADVAEVKHWEWIDNNNGTFTCTACGKRASKMKWCGNCGAKMDGGKHDN